MNRPPDEALDVARASTGLVLLQRALADLDLALGLFPPGGLTADIRTRLAQTFDQLDNAHYRLVHVLYSGTAQAMFPEA